MLGGEQAGQDWYAKLLLWTWPDSKSFRPSVVTQTHRPSFLPRASGNCLGARDQKRIWASVRKASQEDTPGTAPGQDAWAACQAGGRAGCQPAVALCAAQGWGRGSGGSEEPGAAGASLPEEWAHEGAGDIQSWDPGEWRQEEPERAQLGGKTVLLSPPGVEPAESRWRTWGGLDGERRGASLRSPRTRVSRVQMVRRLFKEVPAQSRGDEARYPAAGLLRDSWTWSWLWKEGKLQERRETPRVRTGKIFRKKNRLSHVRHCPQIPVSSG